MDFVTAESFKAGKSAAEYVKQSHPSKEREYVSVTNGNGISYTVPQKIRKSTDSVEIFFRVKKIYTDVTICVECKGDIIARFKRPNLAPGEMEHITLAQKIAEKISGNEIKVFVEEG